MDLVSSMTPIMPISHDAVGGAHVQDDSTVMLQHVPGHRLGHIEDAIEVHPDDLLPLLPGDVQEVVANADPGVVDQDVDSAHDLDGFINGILNLAQIRDVTGDELGQVGQIGCELFPGLPVSIQNHDLRALIEKADCRGKADPAGPARDDHPFVLESPHGSVLPTP
jgi:hypothetical protein